MRTAVLALLGFLSCVPLAAETRKLPPVTYPLLDRILRDEKQPISERVDRLIDALPDHVARSKGNTRLIMPWFASVKSLLPPLVSGTSFRSASNAQPVGTSREAEEERRSRAMERLVESKGAAAVPELKAALSDSSPSVRATAAEALVALGAAEGRKYLSEVLVSGAVTEQRQAVRVLGAHGLGDGAKSVADLVQRLTLKPLPSGSDERALLGGAVLALARSGRSENLGLILRVAEAEFAEPRPSPLIVEAVGRANGPRALELLRNLIRRMDGLGDPAATTIRVTAMLGLTRQGEVGAVERVRSWIRAGGENGKPEGRLTLLALRSTDADRFGMDVLGLAAQEPEGTHTMEAWEALGRMRTQSLARPALLLAISRKPHWRRVSRELLHRALLVMDARVNDEFWDNLGVQRPRRDSPERLLAQTGLWWQLFSATGHWTGD